MTSYIISEEQVREVIYLSRFASFKSVTKLLHQLPKYSERTLEEPEGEGDAPTKNQNVAPASEDSFESSLAPKNFEKVHTGRGDVENPSSPLNSVKTKELNKLCVIK